MRKIKYQRPSGYGNHDAWKTVKLPEDVQIDFHDSEHRLIISNGEKVLASINALGWVDLRDVKI